MVTQPVYFTGLQGSSPSEGCYPGIAHSHGYTGDINQSNPPKKKLISAVNAVTIQGQVETLIALGPYKNLIESQVAVLPGCPCGLEGYRHELEQEECNSDVPPSHLTHQEALQCTIRKVDIEQAFIFTCHQRFCPSHCYLSDESLTLHSISLLCCFFFNI